MMPCCLLYDEEYLETDESVDQEALNEAGDKHGVPPDQVIYDSWGQVVNGRICKCECHIKGSKVMHWRPGDE